MDDKSLIQIAGVLKQFVAAHSPSPPGSSSPHSDPLPEEASIWQLNSAKAQILALSDQSREMTEAFYQAMVEVRRLHISHKAALQGLGQDHQGALADHQQKVTGKARLTVSALCLVLKRFLRGEMPFDQAKSELTTSIAVELQASEAQNDLIGVLEEANAFRTAHEERAEHLAIMVAYVNASRDLRKMVQAP
jgi:hypothetical protein